MHLFSKSLAALAVATTVASASASQPSSNSARLYLFPAAEPITQGKSLNVPEPVSINAADANRVLSHHLNVPGERLGPIVSGARQGEDAWAWSKGLQEENGAKDLLEDSKSRLVIFVDGVDDAEALLPSTSQLRATHHLSTSGVTSDSWSALFSSYGDKLSRVAEASASEASILSGKVFESVAHAAEGIKDWFAGDVVPAAEQSWKKTLDIVDLSPGEAMAAFQSELSSFVSRIDGLVSGKKSDASIPDYQALRFQSLPAVKEAYGESSEQYEAAVKAVGAALQSAVESFKKYSSGKGYSPRLAVVVSDARSSQQALSKRSISDLLAPFSTAPRQFDQRQQQSPFPGNDYASSTSSLLAKPSSSAAPKESDYIGKCFTSKSDLFKATADCSGRGDAFQKDFAGRKCYRCLCKPDRKQEGRVTYFAGEACEKIDVSSPFVLLAVTSIVLILLVGGSIGYMTSMGGEKLPGTLASVSVPNFKLS